MRVAVMQPYFFPYLGYWQLISAVDRYVLFDDVNFINRGWIHRNRIFLSGENHYINLPLKKASQNKKINKIIVDKERIPNIINMIKEAYRKAPFYNEVFPLVSDMILQGDCSSAASYNGDIIRGICDYLMIGTELLLSSCIEKDNMLKGEDKILDICASLHGDHYVNAIGGMKLYHQDKFQIRGIKLSFLKTEKVEYTRFGKTTQSDLSILDILMFNEREAVIEMLGRYSLVQSNDMMIQ